MKLKRLMSLLMSGVLAAGALSAVPGQAGDALAASHSRVSVHDPSIIKANDGTYYVFGSHVDAAKSTDLMNWTRFTNGYTTPNNVEFGNLSQNLAKAFAWAGEDLGDCVGGFAVWAPDVVWDADYVNTDGSKGAYLMYFCTSSTWNTSVIAYASSKNAEGPYTFVDTLVYSGFTSNDTYATSTTKNVNRKYTSTNIDELIAAGEVTYNDSWFNGTAYDYRTCPNAIDPTIYYDTDGKMYMVYGSWSGGIFTLQIDPATGRCIRPKTGTTSDGRMVDSYFGTKLTGGYHKSGEGPFIEYNADTGYYYLWVTYGGLTSTGGYNMRVFRSTSPTGPFTDAAGRSGIMSASSNLDNTGLKVMGNYKFSSLSTAYMACGHNSVLRDDDGQWYLFYHARFDDGTEYHEVRVHQMWFNSEGWPVVAPFEYSGDKLSAGGYETGDIVGDYEFIDHGTATDGNIINYSSVKLNADGTVSGAVSGTWEQAGDSAEAVITIGGQKYCGYFLAAQDESGKTVMSFTAVGNNNHTIWGAKTSAYTGTPRESGVYDYTYPDAKLIVDPDTACGTGASAYVSGEELLSGVTYFITNKNSGLSLDLPNGALDEGTNIQQWDLNKSWAQQWRIVSEDGGWCRIVPVGNEDMCVSVAENSAADGLNVELRRYTGGDEQLFRIVKNGTYYGIVSKCSGGNGALDVFEWSKENGGNVNQYAYHEYDCQLWRITPVYPTVNEGAYIIRNVSSRLPISTSNGAVVGNKEKEEVWIIRPGENGEYTLCTAGTGENILMSKNSAADGVSVSAAAVDVVGSPMTQFTLRCNKDGSYSIFTAVSDNSSALTVTDTALVQQSFTGDGTQRFVLEPVPAGKIPQKVKGDVNADGAFNVADVVMLQEYILGEGGLTDWSAGDFDGSETITIHDLCMMRTYLVETK